jgi:molybdopterin-guanine dinucleotide biosynthesis protein A
MPAGVIVAGGRSTRFGPTDKAVAEFEGVPLVRRVADALAAADAIDTLVVNCRAEQAPRLRECVSGVALPTRIAVDTRPGDGPVAGMCRGLEAALDGGNDAAFVAACDLPFLDPDLIGALLDLVNAQPAAVPRVEGHPQPLHAAYRAERAHSVCRRLLEAGEYRATALLDYLEPAAVPPATVADGDQRSFENVNTRAEFETARVRSRDRREDRAKPHET